MKRIISTLAVATAIAFAPAAGAVDFTPLNTENFNVSGNPLSGTDPVSASIGNEGLGVVGAETPGQDRFLFTIGLGPLSEIGVGSGSISTNFSFGQATNLDFGQIIFNNGFTDFFATTSGVGVNEFAFLNDVPIFSGVLNTLTVNYIARGQGSYGGTLNFQPVAAAVPEPMTWMMMILGFAAVGFAMRRKTKQDVRVRYAF